MSLEIFWISWLGGSRGGCMTIFACSGWRPRLLQKYPAVQQDTFLPQGWFGLKLQSLAPRLRNPELDDSSRLSNPGPPPVLQLPAKFKSPKLSDLSAWVPGPLTWSRLSCQGVWLCIKRLYCPVFLQQYPCSAARLNHRGSFKFQYWGCTLTQYTGISEDGPQAWGIFKRPPGDLSAQGGVKNLSGPTAPAESHSPYLGMTAAREALP